MLLDAGFDIDIFPFYPLNSDLWRYVPEILSEHVLVRSKVHHIGFLKSLTYLKSAGPRKLSRFLGDAGSIALSAARFGLVPVGKSLYVFPKAWAWSQKHLNQYDHVLAYWGNYAASCAYVFHRLMDRPVPFSMFLHAGIDLYWDQVFLRQKLLYADNIFVVCDFNRQFVRRRYPDIYPAISENIHEYHLGLDLSAFPYRPHGRPSRRILGVGTFAKYKGYEFLLRATAELHRRGINCELELVGDGKEANSLKKLARELSISGKVHFPGWLKPADVRAAMENATIFVHPSNGVGDAVPTVIKECMALGTPVIASRTAGIPELLDDGKCGILVPPKDIRAFADGMHQLLESDVLRRAYADAAREYAEKKFDLWRNGHKLAQILSSTNRRRPVALQSSQRY